MTTVKCQAKDPASCTDPQCPERRNYRHQMATATNFADYAAARDRQHADEKNRGRQQFASNFPQSNNRSQRPVAQNQRVPQRKYVETTKEGDPIIKFHKDLGFPKGFNPPSGPRNLQYTQHALDEGTKDRYATIPTFPRINLDTMDLIELKVNARTKKVEKMLYRTELDGDNDLCMVLKPVAPGKMVVITQWINQANDNHSSFLKKDEYVDLRQHA